MNPVGLPDSIEVRRGIKRTLRELIVATIILYGVVITIGALSLKQANRTHDALCTFRGDLQHRVDQSVAFLREHPKGLPHILSGPQLAAQIHNQQLTIAALDELGCG